MLFAFILSATFSLVCQDDYQIGKPGPLYDLNGNQIAFYDKNGKLVTKDKDLSDLLSDSHRDSSESDSDGCWYDDTDGHLVATTVFPIPSTTTTTIRIPHPLSAKYDEFNESDTFQTPSEIFSHEITQQPVSRSEVSSEDCGFDFEGPATTGSLPTFSLPPASVSHLYSNSNNPSSFSSSSSIPTPQETPWMPTPDQSAFDNNNGEQTSRDSSFSSSSTVTTTSGRTTSTTSTTTPATPPRDPQLQGVFTGNPQEFSKSIKDSPAGRRIQEARFLTPYLTGLYKNNFPTQTGESPLRKGSKIIRKKRYGGIDRSAIDKIRQRCAGEGGWSRTITIEPYTIDQRDSLIDPHYVLSGPDRRTNLQRMQDGNPPIGPDNLPVELHHWLQQDPGPLGELSGSIHERENKYFHFAEEGEGVGQRRRAFREFRKRYWQFRARQITAMIRNSASLSSRSSSLSSTSCPLLPIVPQSTVTTTTPEPCTLSSTFSSSPLSSSSLSSASVSSSSSSSAPRSSTSYPLLPIPESNSTTTAPGSYTLSSTFSSSPLSSSSLSSSSVSSLSSSSTSSSSTPSRTFPPTSGSTTTPPASSQARLSINNIRLPTPMEWIMLSAMLQMQNQLNRLSK